MTVTTSFRIVPTLSVLCLSAALLSGCGVYDDWFGEEEQLLPGERVAVLASEDSLQADEEISGVQVTLPPAVRNSEWPQVGGGTSNNMQNLEVGGALTVAWRTSIGTGFSDEGVVTGQPVIVGGRVYVADAFSNISALDASSGNQIWRVDLEPEDEDDGFFGGGVAFDNGQLFVTTGFGGVFALDPGAAPTAADGKVYAITLTNSTYALNAATGEIEWEHTGIQEVAGLVGAASPAVDGTTVIVPYTSGELFGLLAGTGRTLWGESLAGFSRVDQTNQLAQIRGQPVVDDGVVFAISNSGRMSAVDIRRGLRIWDAGVGGTETPWLAGDFLFVVSNTWQLIAISKRDGRIRWATPLERWQDPEDTEGLINWVGPIAASGRLLLASSTGTLLAINPENGQVIGSTDLGSGIVVPPAVANGILYLINRDGNLLALR